MLDFIGKLLGRRKLSDICIREIELEGECAPVRVIIRGGNCCYWTPDYEEELNLKEGDEVQRMMLSTLKDKLLKQEADGWKWWKG